MFELSGVEAVHERKRANMSTSDLNAHKQVFGLSLMANSIRKIKGTTKKLQELAEKKLPALLHEELPGWEVVWGPVVWKHDCKNADTGPDHVFFVAKNPNLAFSNGEQKETYVLAIAATATPYNWIENNARVNEVVNLHEWLEHGISTDPRPLAGVASAIENCYIALGTALGVFRLASIVPPPSAVSPGIALPAYWASFPQSPNTRVILTGHSLGGALSPTLALSLLESNSLGKFERSNVLVYPTAGPTSGNLVFAKLFSDRFPKIPGPGYQVWNCNVVNHLDVVSHAWCASKDASPEQNMHKIPSLYGRPIWEIKFGVDLGISLAGLSLTTYMPLQAIRFRGTPPATQPTTRKQFLQIAEEQHTDEFYKLFDIKIPEDEDLIGEENGLQMTRLEVARTEPVLSEIVVQIEAEQRRSAISEDYKSYRALSEGFTA